MRYLGIDYGARHIGLSVSDPGGTFAFPKNVIPNDQYTLTRIQALVDAEAITHIVIGDTKALNGADNPITEEAKAFAVRLEDATKLPMAVVWEAWSSVEAARFAPQGGEHNDASAAAIILQRYLDSHPRT